MGIRNNEKLGQIIKDTVTQEKDDKILSKIIKYLGIFIIACVFVLCFIAFLLTADNTNSNYSSGQSTDTVIQYEKVPAVVTNTDKTQWFAGCVRRKVSLTVYIEEYDIENTFEKTYNGGMLDDIWNTNENDIVMVEIKYNVSKSNNEMTGKPKITKIVDYTP